MSRKESEWNEKTKWDKGKGWQRTGWGGERAEWWWGRGGGGSRGGLMRFQRLRDTVWSSFIRLSADRNITALSSLTEGLLSASCSLAREKGKEKKWSREKVTVGVQRLKVHYADCRVKMPPFCESNFSFMAFLSAETIHYRLAKSSRVRTIRLTIHLCVCTIFLCLPSMAGCRIFFLCWC